MKKEDPLLNQSGVVRIGPTARKRLGVVVGDMVTVTPFKWETYYHGTRAPDPMVIVRDGWIVGSGNACGSGIYFASSTSLMSGYISTGLITAEVAWGEMMTWPLSGSRFIKQFELWCREHHLDLRDLLSVVSLRNEDDPRVHQVLKWARLYGHYYSGGDYTGMGSGDIRVFPGPIGSGYKPNRLRVVSVSKPDGTVLWQRPRLPR